MTKALLRKIAIGALCTISLNAHAWLVWTIVDPVRDYNWELKSLRDYLILAEKKLANIDKMIGEQMLSQLQMLREESNESSSIRAVTSALSITQNLAAASRSEPSAVEIVCAWIEAGKTAQPSSSCGSIVWYRAEYEVKALEERFIDPEKADGKYYRNIFDESVDGVSNEKAILQVIGNDVQAYSHAVNNFELISESSSSNFESVSNLLFDYGVTLPDPNEVSRLPNAFSVDEYLQYFHSNTAKAFVTRSLRDRTEHSGSYAKDAALIESATETAIERLNAEIGDVEMSDQALRVLATSRARNLKNEFKLLELRHREQAATALALKKHMELQGY
ncbi:hypothetical protein [Vibrio agarivorans]|uniref:hypothetical protein n=1 Tax=Vibrio agarivorans TaxID=153622 RepID=UPI0025B46760|nr:hypothetical protein [Vibrio agarivorans]MDN3661101.1 hypothetical protein [Vibrio agarivorans]